MKRKIICMSMIGLLLLTGVASFSVAAEPMEQNTPVVKSQAGDSVIDVSGGFFGGPVGLFVHIKIIPTQAAKDKPYHWSYSITFTGTSGDVGYTGDSGFFSSNIRVVRLSSPSLSFMRRNTDLNSRSGTIYVHVDIQEYNGGPLVQVYEKDGTFRGPFVFI